MDKQDENGISEDGAETQAGSEEETASGGGELPPEPEIPLSLIRSMIDNQEPVEDTRNEEEARLVDIPDPAAHEERKEAIATDSRWDDLRVAAEEPVEEFEAGEGREEFTLPPPDLIDEADLDLSSGRPIRPEGSKPESGVDGDDEALPETPLSPIERIRARDAERAQSHLREAPPEPESAANPDVDYTPFSESAFGATGTHDEPQPSEIHTPGIEDPETEAAPAVVGYIQPKNPAPPRDWGSVADHEMSKGAKWVWRSVIYGSLVTAPVLFFVLSPFSPKDTVAHNVTRLGCQFGALFELENMKEGEPGYHASLDEDSDGIACEKRKQRLSAGGGAGFRSP